MSKITVASPSCLNLVKHFESLKRDAYLCPARVPTIGFGTTLYPTGKKVQLGDVCTSQQANDYLKHDLGYFEKMVDAYTRDDISQQQFDALVSFCYNLGAGNLKASTLLKVINADPLAYDRIKVQFLRWNRAGGKELNGLTRRRNAEFYLYRTGILKFDF